MQLQQLSVFEHPRALRSLCTCGSCQFLTLLSVLLLLVTPCVGGWVHRPTPPHPEYPSGHTAVSHAIADTLIKTLGRDDVTFSFTAEGKPGMTRTYKSISAAAKEVAGEQTQVAVCVCAVRTRLLSASSTSTVWSHTARLIRVGGAGHRSNLRIYQISTTVSRVSVRRSATQCG